MEGKVHDLLAKRCGPRICSWVPLGLWHRLLSVELVLPYYHVVSDQELPHVSELYRFRSIRQFKADLEFFLSSYIPVDMQNVIDHLDGSARLPRRCFLLTFDDGLREIYDVVAPMLYTRGIPAAVFLPSAVLNSGDLLYTHKKSLLIRAIEASKDLTAMREVSGLLRNAGLEGGDLSSTIRRIAFGKRQILDKLGAVLGCDFNGYADSVRPYVTIEQTRSLIKQGFEVGAHSVDHPRYSELCLKEQVRQTLESRSYLTNEFQYACRCFAFPFEDRGVSPGFFSEVFADGRLRVSFSTSGMLPHFFPRNLPRFSMERVDLTAEQICAREFGRTLMLRWFDGGRRG
jgi:peptidoglycan/xylan/chitin deacetylase (PgdA/CDA1 family)